MFNRYLFSKAEGQITQISLFYAFVNVHNVNVKTSIFDVIGRLNATEHKISSCLMSQVKAFNTLHRRKSIARHNGIK